MSVISVRAHGLTRADLVVCAALSALLIVAAVMRFTRPEADLVLGGALVLFAPLSVTLGFIDVRTRRLPDALVLPGLVGFAAVLVLDGILRADVGMVMRGLLGAFIPFMLFWAVAALVPGSVGGGDVKYVALTGGVSAWVGTDAALVALFVAFLAAGIFSLTALIVRRNGRTRTVPFGPFLSLGAWGGILVCS